jgi:hypothetical protein
VGNGRLERIADPMALVIFVRCIDDRERGGGVECVVMFAVCCFILCVKLGFSKAGVAETWFSKLIRMGNSGVLSNSTGGVLVEATSIEEESVE